MNKISSLKNILIRSIGAIFILYGLSSCTSPGNIKPQGKIQPASNKAPSSHQQRTAVPNRLEIKKFGDKIILSLPIPKNTQIDPRYDYPFLTLVFDQPLALPHFDPKKLPAAIQKIQFKTMNQNQTQMNIRLAQKSQFLISRPMEEKVKITIVPQANAAAYKVKPDRAEKSVLTDIDFSQDQEHKMYVTLKTSQGIAYRLLDSKSNKLKILLTPLDIPKNYLKLYRLQKFGGPIEKALLETRDNGGILTLYLKKPTPVSIQTKGHDLVLAAAFGSSNNSTNQTVKPSNAENSENNAPPRNQTATKTKDKTPEVRPQLTLFPGMKKGYHGRHISIDLQDADIEHVLRLIADVGGFNLILDQDVQGKISLKLNDVPWDQALDLVLLQKDLGMIQQGHILRIATSAKLQKEQDRILNARKAALEAQKKQQELSPLHTEYIQINYSTAAEIEPQISKFLSKRGQSSFDSRTNQLIISDTLARINKIKRVVRKLDRPEKQVLIEARLVYATDQFQRSLGLKWGGGYVYQSTYNGDSYNQGLYGTTGDTSAAATTDNNGFAVNLPNQGDTTLGIGAFISKLTGSDLYTLDAQLELGESEGQVKTISSPRVVTLNNQQAEVVQGTKIATKAESESGGTTTQYTEATLKLSVLPQITPDNKLILDLNISDDSPVPGGEDIETKSTKTKLIVNDGETIVIGGVQQVTESTAQSKVPGMANIPILGWFFKNKYKSREKRELLIFIRPKIL